METKLFRGMECRRMGNSGLWVSEVGLGTRKWGDPSYDVSRLGDHGGFEILDRALELGVFHWDTACSYNLAERNKVATEGEDRTEGSEKDFLGFAAKQNNGVIPFFPLAGGLLTGRYRKGSIDETGRIIKDGDYWQKLFLTERNLDLVDRLDAIAHRKDCSMSQLAIAWLLSHDVIPSVIAVVTRMEHLENNAGATSVELSDDDLKEIDDITS